jgi:alpha-D-xyloside xylohydrolase
VTLPFSREEGVFGLGLTLKSVLQSGRKKIIRVNSDPVCDTGDSHAPVPFYVSTAGYGVLVDTARYASFYFGTHAPLDRIAERVREKNKSEPPSPEEIYKTQCIGETVVVDIPAARGIDVYIFAGPDALTAVQRYNLFSGGGCLPPIWGLGNWYRLHSGTNAGEALQAAAGFRADGIPIDGIGLEPGWQSAFYPNTFAWSHRFPDPAGFIKGLAGLGYHVNLWENAFIHPEAPFRKAIEPFCADATSTDGFAPDFLVDEARRIFAEHHERVLVDAGVAAFKLDECDNSDFIPFSWSFPEYARFPSGADGEQMHALLGVQYQTVIDEIFKKRGQRHYSLVRSSGALAAPLPFVLYSDLYDHKDFLRGMAVCGFSGLLWTPEVRDAKDVEDLVRRVQSVVLSPYSMINGWYIKNPPWFNVECQPNNDGIPMAGAERAKALVKSALELRMRLLPCIYAAFAEYRENGKPPFRPLALEFPADKATWTIDNQWLIGANILVAPMTAGETSRRVYLPEGGWRDFWTGALHKGGGVIDVAAGLDSIPLFVKDGTVLPLAEVVPCVRSDTVFRITPFVYSDGPAKGRLYDDDGETSGARLREGAWIDLDWDPKSGLTVKTKPPPGASRYDLGGPWAAVKIMR